jgi:signal transduction histidine kinase
MGLVGMRERIELLDGQVRVGPTPDGGWAVDAEVPA